MTVQQADAAVGGSVFRVALRAGLKSLLVSAVFFIAALLCGIVSPVFGGFVMIAGSAFLFLRCYRKDLPLKCYTILIAPAGATLVLYINYPYESISLIMCFAAITGLVLGVLNARGQKVYSKNSTVYAQKSILVILVWSLTLILNYLSRYYWGLEHSELPVFLCVLSTFSIYASSLLVFIKYRDACKSGGGHPPSGGSSPSSLILLFVMFAGVWGAWCHSYDGRTGQKPEVLEFKVAVNPGLDRNATRIAYEAVKAFGKALDGLMQKMFGIPPDAGSYNVKVKTRMKPSSFSLYVDRKGGFSSMSKPCTFNLQANVLRGSKRIGADAKVTFVLNKGSVQPNGDIYGFGFLWGKAMIITPKGVKIRDIAKQNFKWRIVWQERFRKGRVDFTAHDKPFINTIPKLNLPVPPIMFASYVPPEKIAPPVVQPQPGGSRGNNLPPTDHSRIDPNRGLFSEFQESTQPAPVTMPQETVSPAMADRFYDLVRDRLDGFNHEAIAAAIATGLSVLAAGGSMAMALAAAQAAAQAAENSAPEGGEGSPEPPSLEKPREPEGGKPGKPEPPQEPPKQPEVTEPPQQPETPEPVKPQEPPDDSSGEKQPPDAQQPQKPGGNQGVLDKLSNELKGLCDGVHDHLKSSVEPAESKVKYDEIRVEPDMDLPPPPPDPKDSLNIVVNTFQRIQRVAPTKTNEQLVYEVVKDAKVRKRCDSLFSIFKTFGSFSPGQSVGENVVSEASGHGAPDGVGIMKDFVMKPTSLEKMWDRLEETPPPENREQLDRAIKELEAKPGEKSKDLEALYDIKRLFNSLGGTNVKYVPGK